ncbi:MAG: hydroxymethylbilane synthase [Planctomycetes bacterium]|nr:hydroxymethylbilane synthase [Planctomycetota bacterium]
MKPIRIASRSSKLALAQTHMTRDAILAIAPDCDITVVPISTTGDTDKSEFLYKSQTQGLFTSEVEAALLDGRADMAVHSLKDLPTQGPDELIVAAMPRRESPEDVLITRHTVSDIQGLPSGATVGTSSLRRIAQIKQARSDLDCVPLRGNVETRLAKVTNGQVDAAVMAHAGLNRLGLSDHISAVLPLSSFLPAPAQGALAIQARKDLPELVALIARLDDPNTRFCVETERLILATMHGGCSIPLGVYASVQADQITVSAMIGDTLGKTCVQRAQTVPLDQAFKCVEEMALELLNAGGREILEAIRAEKAE